MKARLSWSHLLALVLVVSAALRAWLVWHGGQFFWSDESRYYAASEAIARLGTGGFFARLLDGADHLFFKVLMLVPAGINAATVDQSIVPGLFCAAFSVANIALVARIARAAGAGAREAFVAALLMAAANANFYFARHLLPYDAALTFGLLALRCGWFGQGAGRSFGCGVLAALAFLTYNGYWLIGAVVLVGHVLLGGRDRRGAVRRAAWSGAGLMLPIAGFVVLARTLAHVDLIASFRAFAGTITQGDFGGGARLIAAYFWAAEGINAVLLVAGLMLAAAGALVARRWDRGAHWVLGAVGVLAGLWLLSDVWHQFVVYGRTARQVLPFACLAAAFAAERLWRTGGVPARLATGAVLLGLGQTVANFWAPLQQVFPTEFQRTAQRVVEQAQKNGEQRQLVVLYAEHLLSDRALFTALPDHDVWLAEANPLQFRPYLFEGFNAALRARFAASDLRMRLIAVNESRFSYPTDLRRPYPGVVQLTLQLPADKPNVYEPLLVTGGTGQGDLVYLKYEPPGAIRLGFDHWGVGGQVSEPIAVDYAQPVTVVLSTGPLHDRQTAVAAPSGAPDLRHWLYAEVNGRVIWSGPAEFYPASAASITFGTNYIGGSTADPKFSGTILKVQSLLFLPPALGRAR